MVGANGVGEILCVFEMFGCLGLIVGEYGCLRMFGILIGAIIFVLVSKRWLRWHFLR